MNLLLILVLGFLFGLFLRLAKLNRFDTISGLATLEDLTLIKALLTAIGAGIILVNLEIGLGLAEYHLKPFLVSGILLGGILFGSGMAILGYCPGTLAVSIGEGSVDAFIGAVGGLLGGLLFTLAYPVLHSLLGPNLGKISLSGTLNAWGAFYIIAFLIGASFIWLAFRLHRKSNKGQEWLYAGLMLAGLEGIVFLKSMANRPIGASTAYPYGADALFGATGNDYFKRIATSGNWELWFLLGALLAGFAMALVKKEFKLVLIHDRWRQHKGARPATRVVWAFFGGFLLIFGARLAGGCTSGHILSGSIQLAYSSLVFGVVAFGVFLLVGRLFYRSR